jgi:hypothetical protein
VKSAEKSKWMVAMKKVDRFDFCALHFDALALPKHGSYTTNNLEMN